MVVIRKSMLDCAAKEAHCTSKVKTSEAPLEGLEGLLEFVIEETYL